ncbi:DNA topoisomerase 1 [Saitoella coloradoensis]
MSSSDEDIPLAVRRKQNPPKVDDAAADAPVSSKVHSKATIPKSLDDEVDAEQQPLPKKRKPPISNVKTALTGTDSSKRNAASSDSEEDVPLSKRQKTTKAVKSEPKSDSEDDVPLAKRAAAKRSAPAKSMKEESDSSDLSDAESVQSAPKKKKAAPKRKAVKDDSDSDSDTPLAKRAPAKKAAVKKESTPKAAPKKRMTKAEKLKSEEAAANGSPAPSSDVKDEDEEEYKWWEAQNNDGSVKWTTLEHSGVLFPTLYEPLPSHVKMKYNGKPIELHPDAEEVAGFFAAMIETDHARNPTFVKNFFGDFQAVIKKSGGAKSAGQKVSIDKFESCDFRPMFEYFEKKKEEKKAMTKEEKKAAKAEKDKQEERYKFCLLDGRKEKVGNFRIEPPGLFRGRGEHPKTGKLKQRVMPEQITINIGKNAPVPTPPEGHSWKEVRHDNTVTWLATWNENVNNNVKYVFLAAGSSLKGQSDLKKFEKARKLKDHIKQIRKDYTNDLRDKHMAIRQRATAMYLIDKFALRAGNEKGDDEADTVGCCSLRFEHVTLTPPNKVAFDFLGKDSIRYYNEVEVDEQVFKNLKIFKKAPKTEGDMLFDRLNTTQLNKHLGSLMDGLSAKVFRTYNASHTFQEQLKSTPKDASVADKILAYNRANRMVAILCNHQKSVSKNHGQMMEKMTDKIRALKYQKIRCKRQILALDPKLKKKRSELTEYDSDIDDEWIKAHQKDLVEKEKEKISKKFAKENEALLAEDKKPMKDSELEERLAAADALAEEFEQENKAGVLEPKSKSATVEKLDQQIQKLDERILVEKTRVTDKEENKETALGTSKLNYIDPRLSYAWCAKYDVPIEKIFAATLREKFKWAQVDADWVF